MNEKITLFFAKHKILFIVLNLTYIIILAKSFQLLAYPNADFSSALQQIEYTLCYLD